MRMGRSLKCNPIAVPRRIDGNCSTALVGNAMTMITPIYASILTIIYITLSVRVIGARRSAAVGLGDGGDRNVLRATRVHANFAEYVPLALVLMMLAELQSAPVWLLHAMGVALIGGRALHAYGMGQDPEPIRCRVIGMATTFTVLATGALANIVLAL